MQRPLDLDALSYSCTAALTHAYRSSASRWHPGSPSSSLSSSAIESLQGSFAALASDRLAGYLAAIASKLKITTSLDTTAPFEALLRLERRIAALNTTISGLAHATNGLSDRYQAFEKQIADLARREEDAKQRCISYEESINAMCDAVHIRDARQLFTEVQHLQATNISLAAQMYDKDALIAYLQDQLQSARSYAAFPVSGVSSNLLDARIAIGNLKHDIKRLRADMDELSKHDFTREISEFAGRFSNRAYPRQTNAVALQLLHGLLEQEQHLLTMSARSHSIRTLVASYTRTSVYSSQYARSANATLEVSTPQK